MKEKHTSFEREIVRQNGILEAENKSCMKKINDLVDKNNRLIQKLEYSRRRHAEQITEFIRANYDLAKVANPLAMSNLNTLRKELSALDELLLKEGFVKQHAPISTAIGNAHNAINAFMIQTDPVFGGDSSV